MKKILIKSNGQWELTKTDDSLNNNGVSHKHISDMKEALQHFESPPSAHAYVKAHYEGRDLK